MNAIFCLIKFYIQAMRFGERTTPDPHIYLNGDEIKLEKSARHLGNIILHNLKDDLDVQYIHEDNFMVL